MKFNKFMAMAMAAALAVVSCGEKEKEETPDTDEPVVEKSTACKMTALTLNVGDDTIEGFFLGGDEDFLEFEIAYYAEQFEALKSATATVTISEKATVSPDPAVPADYTVEGQPVQFVVTAEDGETSATYTVVLREIIRVISVGDPIWQKTLADLGASESVFRNSSIGFCDRTHFATDDLSVFDLEGNRVGSLCLDGLAVSGVTALSCLSSTADGVLVATIAVNADNVPCTGEDDIRGTYYYAWLNGWESAPTLIIDSFIPGANGAKVHWYFTVQGDSKGDCTLVMRSAVSANQAFNFYHYTNGLGNAESLQWAQKTTGYSSVDGNWGQWITMPTSDPTGTIVICDSNNPGVSHYTFYVRNGYDADPAADVQLYGNLDSEYAGPTGYGNYSTGFGRAFTYLGQEYIVCCTAGWASAYITIQSLHKDENGADVYLLDTQTFDGLATSQGSAAFMYDEATQTGHVICFVNPYMAIRYDITVEEI